jgi:hypothetical protein
MGAKAHRFVSCMYGLKPVPFRERKRAESLAAPAGCVFSFVRGFF